ncbi:helicase C-terminal domain-containing protein [Marinilactibacillus kalidii]|uniref:helicase C-terminal domain-containing protein n=1 Tax=Marinilactibacillus kalidii TaxID=2820274 RepID=UPI001ABDF72F|nr:helicase C-terminal domain-containing protein [Marinilactibacillus kalidii]
MKTDQIYAVVDIESTGGSIGKDKMIQFACVLVKNGEILEKFDTFVNPSKTVPQRIQELTGIHPKELKTAPYFEDIAPLLHAMLEQTIFVAHNVGFDFQFLNEEFRNIGLPELTIPAMDTVQLAQVIFPTASSYALQEIVDWLGYDLNRPHNALFDAEATVFLMNEMNQKLRTLPLTTIEKLAELSNYCIAETNLFFGHVLEEMKANPVDLREDLIILDGVAIKDPSATRKATQYRMDKHYPLSSDDKVDLLDASYLKREAQEEMMNQVYQYFKKAAPNAGLAIEAPPGSGKSLGYLLPACFEATNEEPILISTKTTVLQRQMMEETLSYLEQLVPFELSVASVKGKQNYLSLANFDYKLSHIDTDDIESLFSMRVLVWLTETETGDIDEMGAGGNSSHEFWTNIRTGSSQLSSHFLEKWLSFDFYLRAEKQLEAAAIIVTNHAFLVQDWKKEVPLFRNVKKLIVDEAHFFPDVIQQAATVSISSSTFSKQLKKIGNLERTDSILSTLNQLVNKELIRPYQLNAIESNRQLFESEWADFIEQWINKLGIEMNTDPSVLKWHEIEVSLAKLNLSLKKQLKELTTLIYEIVYVGNHIIQKTDLAHEQLSVNERFNLTVFKDILQDITSDAQTLKAVFNQNEQADYSWVSYFSKNPQLSLTFKRASYFTQDILQEKLQQYTHTVFTSSSLSYDGSSDFFKNQIGAQELEYVSLTTPYQYKEQVKVFVPDHSSAYTDFTKEEYVQYMIESIEKIVKDTSENALILFRSNDTLQKVYRGLQKRKGLDKKLILAQNLSGTKAKLIKQFKKSKNALLLGADTFWEGVDLPGDALKIVIVTKLPFDSPDQPSVKLRLKKIADQNQNAFIHDMLPRAVMRLKQGFGRLIRSENDKGVFVILDHRFVHSSYAKAMRQSLPDELQIEEINWDEISDEVRSFIEKE